MKTMTRLRRSVQIGWNKPWIRALLYVAVIPLLPEYFAPVLGVFAFIAAFKDAKASRRPLAIGAVGKVLLIYIVYMALTLPFAKKPLQSLESYLLWILMFVGYLAVVNILADRTRLDTALYVITLVAGVVGLIGCLQYFFRFVGLNVPLQLWEPVDKFVFSLLPMNIDMGYLDVRVSSTFNNPNIVGQYLVMVTPFTAYYAFHGERENRRTLCRFCLLASIGCAAFTFSRGTYLALLMVALILVITNVRNIVTILLSILSALLLIPDAVWNRLISVGTMDVSSLERLGVWERCIGLIAKNPVFGSGCGVQYVWSVMNANGVYAPHAHNLVLQLLVEGGIVGLCLMLFLGFRVVQNAFTLSSRKESRLAGVTLLTFVAGFCTNAMVEYAFTFPKLMGMFAFVLAGTDAICCLQLNHALSPLTETLTLGGRLFGKHGVTVHK